jgi:hypothetical protein
MEMGQYVEVITHKGKEIVFLNMNGLQEEEQIKAIDEAEKLFQTKNNILNLTDVGNTVTSPAVRDRANQLHSNQKSRIKAQAVVGVSGLKRMIAQGMNKDMYFAKTLDDAKEWLIQQ